MPLKLVKFLSVLLALAALTVGVNILSQFLGNPKANVGDEKKETIMNATPVHSESLEQKQNDTVTVKTETNALVTRVVDGDTIHVKPDGQTEDVTVRLLGINTPESVDPRRPVECFGKEASVHAKGLLEGKRIRLEPDLQADDHDKYNRLLRKVVMEDGRNFNTLMVADGFALAYTSFPMNAEYKRELKKLQEEARLAGRGLWAAKTCNGKK
ncbi:thermonuclease family protein [Candidatus Uhrbacteria bacterium]|nr:thermonuclease family protein [Candidatus Uhrbacteria bacterium]